jgi:WD40 repeat protein
MGASGAAGRTVSTNTAHGGSSSMNNSSSSSSGSSGSSNFMAKNSQTATDYALKRREQMARATELRKERDTQTVIRQRQEDLGSLGRNTDTGYGGGYSDGYGDGSDGFGSRRGSASSGRGESGIGPRNNELVPRSNAGSTSTARKQQQVNVPSNVEITSYGDFCERIVVRNPNARQNQYPQLGGTSEEENYVRSTPSSAVSGISAGGASVSGRVTSKRMQNVLAKARANAEDTADCGTLNDRFSNVNLSGRSSKPAQHLSAGRDGAYEDPARFNDGLEPNAGADDSPFFSQPYTLHAPRVNSSSFIVPPMDPSGRLYDLSDRPLMCASSNMRTEVVFGGTDHALYAVDLADPRRPHTQLFSKKYGHTDWVTSCAHLRDGRLISAAMDCRILLWSLDRRSCTELAGGHDKSVSKVITDCRYNIALSCGYDCRAAVWSFPDSSQVTNVAGRSRTVTGSRATTSALNSCIAPTGYLVGSNEPMLDCTFMDNIATIVCRDGSVLLFDMTSNQCVREYKGHTGQITALDGMRYLTSANGNGDESMAGACFATGGTDGYIKVWDARVRGSAVMEKRPHVSRAPTPSGASTSSAARPPQKSKSIAASLANSKTKSASAPSASSGTAMRAATVASLASFSSRGSSNGASTYLASAGSDSRIFILDIRQALGEVCSYDHAKVGLYSLCVAGDSCLFAGDGSGMIYCYDINVSTADGLSGQSDPYYGMDTAKGALKYGLQASSGGAVRNIVCAGGKLAAGCEDGKAVVYTF